MNIEKFSHVMHMVSNIRGKLLPNKNSFDALIGGFPAGTVSGAPKIRAMEIINELENDKRGIYSGAVGYYDFCGNLNTCIAIRTFVMKDDKVFFQAGAGIVHDSDPEKEFNETIHKAKALNKKLKVISFGIKNKKSDIKFIKIKKSKKFYEIIVKQNNSRISFFTQNEFRNNIYNILSALSVMSIYLDISNLKRNIFLNFKLGNLSL